MKKPWTPPGGLRHRFRGVLVPAALQEEERQLEVGLDRLLAQACHLEEELASSKFAIFRQNMSTLQQHEARFRRYRHRFLQLKYAFFNIFISTSLYTKKSN